MQILALIIAPIGDTLFATPSLQALRNGYPAASIDVVATSSNKQILAGNKNIDKLITISNKAEMFKTLISLREKVYDLVIGLSNIGSYVSYLVNGRRKTGFKGQDLDWIYDQCPPDDRTIHAVDYNLAIACDVGGIADENPEMEISLTADNYKVLENINLKNDISLLAVHPGGKFFTFKRWPAKKYRSFIKTIDRNINAQIVLLGGKDEKQLAEELIDIDYDYSHYPLNLAGSLSLKATAALLDKAAVFIGNDSAPQHIAAAVNTPVISIFGPTNPENFHPYGTEYRLVRKERDCSPCFHWLGDLTQYFPECIPQWLGRFTVPCMQNIEVKDVMDALESFHLQFSTLIS